MSSQWEWSDESVMLCARAVQVVFAIDRVDNIEILGSVLSGTTNSVSDGAVQIQRRKECNLL